MDESLIQSILEEMQNLYLQDSRPWIIGLSGGKDSTCVTQLIYNMLKNLPPEKRNKEIFVVSSDTLVDTPIADNRRKKLCLMISEQAKKDGLPIKVRIIRPELGETFWINLIGRGYPSPNRWFRWCTDRLKIRPMNKFTLEQIKENGEVIIVLGIRKSESQNRERTIKKYEIKNSKLSLHNEIAGAFVYAPIAEWQENEVWDYILSYPSPWGDDNKFLLQCYCKGEDDIEFIIDAKGKAGGSSRLGCWVCTVVPKDWSVEAYIEEGQKWLIPLKEFRDYLHAIRDDPSKRFEFRKEEKRAKIYADLLGKNFEGLVRFGHKVYGPFTFQTRHELFIRLLRLQTEPSELKEKLSEFGVVLISPEEVEAIIKLWIYEGDDIAKIDSILQKCGAGAAFLQHLLNKENGKYKQKMDDICQSNNISPDLIDKLLIIEKDFSSLSKRHGLFNKLEHIIENYALERMTKLGSKEK